MNKRELRGRTRRRRPSGETTVARLLGEEKYRFRSVARRLGGSAARELQPFYSDTTSADRKAAF